MDDKPKTFEDLGLRFDNHEDCLTCNSGSCHNNVISKKNGKEYNLMINVDYDIEKYFISASENSSTSSTSDIFEIFDKEEEAVQYVCERFDGFKCF